jgi:fatty-acyl-CoA synthase
MVTVLADGKFSARAFADHVNETLPVYARPVFVRLARTLETTGTFKYRKVDLVADGFDPETGTGTVYMRGGKSGYQKLSAEGHAAIMAGETRL